MAYEDILEELRATYAMEYSFNYLVSIVSNEVPKKIARLAHMMRVEAETPANKKKKCIRCGKTLPINELFFSHNNSHKDTFSNTCKECDRRDRIRRGVVGSVDLRTKDPTLHKM